MGPYFLIASEREEDHRFGEFLAFANDLPCKIAPSPDVLQKALQESPKSIVFWNGEIAEKAIPVSEVLSRAARSSRVFVVTDEPLNTYPHLASAPIFSHHVFRRYESPAPALFARLVNAALQPLPFGLQRYFMEEVKQTEIVLKRSGQKRAAVEAIQNFFTKQHVNSRLAALVAQACDELLMNAIFDAPVLPNGLQLRRGTPRDVDFELIDREHVQLNMTSNDEYVGICVSDQFGSLKKNILMSFLAKDYQAKDYELRKGDHGAGLGLHGIVQCGLSMLFVCKPGVRTEVMIFFGKDASYKSFRTGFRSFGVIAPEGVMK